MRVERAVVVSSPIHLPRLRQMIAKDNAGIIFDVVGYDLGQCKPRLHWQSVYWQIHHEFAAWLMNAILSDDGYDELMNKLRASKPIKENISAQTVNRQRMFHGHLRFDFL